MLRPQTASAVGGKLPKSESRNSLLPGTKETAYVSRVSSSTLVRCRSDLKKSDHDKFAEEEKPSDGRLNKRSTHSTGKNGHRFFESDMDSAGDIDQTACISTPKPDKGPRSRGAQVN